MIAAGGGVDVNQIIVPRTARLSTVRSERAKTMSVLPGAWHRGWAGWALSSCLLNDEKLKGAGRADLTRAGRSDAVRSCFSYRAAVARHSRHRCLPSSADRCVY